MRPSIGRHARNALLALAFLGLVGWYAPSFFSVEHYRGRLETALGRTLGRPVRFGRFSFLLLPRPGFSIENVVVEEDPRFGSEPFARVSRIDCGLRWRTLWHSRFDFAHLYLDHPSFNFVRNAGGEWNFESLLLRRELAPRGTRAAPTDRDNRAGGLDLEAAGARINFKVGADKKPFAFINARAQVELDPGWQQVRYRVAGNPIRAGLLLPTPGPLELIGVWNPGRDLMGPLDATLRTRGALLYNWAPLVSGHSPELYGVLDGEIHLSGSIRVIGIEGEVRLSQLHRWEWVPPSDPMSLAFYFRGIFDRTRGRAVLDSLDISFADSHLHVSGAVDRIPGSPDLDFVIALERSRLEDLLALGRRLWGRSAGKDISGRVDGLLTVQGPWKKPRYGGFVGARAVVLKTASGTFPVSEIDLRIDNTKAQLVPVKINLGPHVELIAQGALYRSGAHAEPRPRWMEPTAAWYELTLLAKGVSLQDLLRFGRAIGVRWVQNLDAEGLATAAFRLTGSASPFGRPRLAGHVEVRAAHLLVPGLTEPLNIPRARIEVNDDQIVADPMVAVMDTSVFTGRLEHRGERKEPWTFEVRANRLSLDQGALWFDALRYRQALPLLARLPGLRSFAARRLAASDLFSAVNAQGTFAAPAVTYRALTLRDFGARVAVMGRVVRIDGASFRAGEGRGQGTAQVDLTYSPAQVTGDISVVGVDFEALAALLPAVLKGVRGSISGGGNFKTLGLTRSEMADNLQGQATLRLKNIIFGDFDPLDAMVRHAGWGALEPAQGGTGIRSAVFDLEFQDRQAILRGDPVELAGAKMELTGTYNFDGTADLHIDADLGRMARQWMSSSDENDPDTTRVHLHLSGPLKAMAVRPALRVSRARP